MIVIMLKTLHNPHFVDFSKNQTIDVIVSTFNLYPVDGLNLEHRPNFLLYLPMYIFLCWPLISVKWHYTSPIHFSIRESPAGRQHETPVRWHVFDVQLASDFLELFSVLVLPINTCWVNEMHLHLYVNLIKSIAVF